MSALDAFVLVRRRDMISALHSGWRCAGLSFDAALYAAEVDVEGMAVPACSVDAGCALAALDRLNAAVEALAAERDALRDERDALRDRVARAVAELDAAPDADPEKPSKRAMREVLQVNTRAWAVLTEGRDPPSVRREQEMPQIASGNAK